MIITPPKLSDIPTMREIVRPEVERGVILERSVDTMANMIRSYRIAWEEKAILDSKPKKLILEKNPLSALKNPVMLGFCALHLHSVSLAEIRSLIVAPFAQRLSVATAMILDCQREGKILGVKEILVLTYKRELFEKLDFIEISKDKIPNQKIWADCILCKHFPLCEEIALIKEI
ncbi:GNAT family N-acetyltransferase [Helicobacter turcicus]|uniref:GNAT family N-acetyltransferase n=1 Tax=Helicobacter turcicus TaxID=2867412 RepID=A0ABS7JMF7_9HELI|nr:GNAT family N-acetyltransferase [Helicobacter turcicus]MBX7490584.1 GNAT family N-acetyltransferase [Helicobacter turcicus]MBX7545506.1 GNAT family N-acetyltransferase [Helicobacter turcicus]